MCDLSQSRTEQPSVECALTHNSDLSSASVGVHSSASKLCSLALAETKFPEKSTNTQTLFFFKKNFYTKTQTNKK
jgi:hypothetical protein